MNSLSNPMMNRNYAMDTLRALMMIIGIVFHASIIFCHKQYVGQWTLLDKHSSYFFDVLIGIIHSFRMPLFFFASGFCTSILYQKKGTKDFLKNRFKRIALPFLAAYIIICPLMELVTFYGNYKLNAMPFSMSNFLNINAYLFHPLYHLWFLYYLIFYVLLVATFEQIFKNEPVIITQFKHFIKRINQNFWFKFLGISTVFFIYFFFLKKTYLFIQLNWSIELLTFIIYFILFGYGWLVYKTTIKIVFIADLPSQIT
ncbi:MAG: acyltransferase family protein, partial [Alphaproteobacteria bacterium]|nr:acyltransferase family protein [Alphaproteobacteria bacterium]